MGRPTSNSSHRYLVPLDEFLAALERLRHFDRLQGDVVREAAAAALAASSGRHVRGFPTDPHQLSSSSRQCPALAVLSFTVVF